MRTAGRLVHWLAGSTGAAVRLGAVTGRIPHACTACRPSASCGERRLFTAHATTAHSRGPGGIPLTWVAHAQVASRVGHLDIPDLRLFLEGYVEGWIPDGWITLDGPGA